MMRNKAKFRRGRAAGLLWFAGSLAALLVYWWVMADFVIKDFWDPQYALKAERLEERMKEYPGHPLWLVMGGSRVEAGIRPQLLAGRMKEKDAPLLFNFGLSGADIFRQMICLKRLINDGVKPQKVMVEIMGPLMALDESYFISGPSLLPRARNDEIAEYCSYSPEPAARRREWLWSRINPLSKYGMRVPHQTLSLRLIPLPFMRRLDKHFYDQWGWVAMPAAPIPESEYRRGFEIAKKTYGMEKVTRAVTPASERATREIIEACKKAGIEVYLLQMPENEDFQALCPAPIYAQLDSFLEKMRTEYGVRRINARSWIKGDAFTDGHHLNANGGEQFTLMLMQELAGNGAVQAAH